MRIDFTRIDLLGVDFVRIDLVAPNPHNILVKRTYLNSPLFSNLASDGYVSIQTQYWHQIRETTQQAVLAYSLGVLTESVARNDKGYDTCKRDKNR